MITIPLIIIFSLIYIEYEIYTSIRDKDKYCKCGLNSDFPYYGNCRNCGKPAYDDWYP